MGDVLLHGAGDHPCPRGLCSRQGQRFIRVSALTMVFCVNGYFLRSDSGLGGEDVIPPLLLGVALTAAGVGVIGRRPWSRWNLLLWSAVVVCAVVRWSNVSNRFYLALPTWSWQALFAGTGTMLAVSPVVDLLQERGIEGRLEARRSSGCRWCNGGRQPRRAGQGGAQLWQCSHLPAAKPTFGIEDLAGDPGAVVGNEPRHQARDVIGGSPTTRRKCVSDLTEKLRIGPSRIGGSWIDGIHGDATVNESVSQGKRHLMNRPLADRVGNLLSHRGKVLARSEEDHSAPASSIVVLGCKRLSEQHAGAGVDRPAQIQLLDCHIAQRLAT